MDEQPSYVCPRCGARSYNPADIADRYCARCYEFFPPPSEVRLEKGMRVHACWQSLEAVALAGETPKLGMSCGNFTGVVKHIRGNRPTNPTEIRFWIAPDDGGDEIVVKPEWIVAVLDPKE